MSPGNEPSKPPHWEGWATEARPLPQLAEIGKAQRAFPFSRFKRKYKVKLVEKRAFRELQ